MDTYRFVQQEENAGEKVAWMCRQLGVPRSSYYRWRDATDTPTTIRHRELTDQVKSMFDSSDQIFGHRMVHTKLAADGVAVSVGTVATIMAENGWVARRMRAFKRTTIPGDPDKVFKDLIGRDFTAATPGTRLVGDITYLRTGEGWLYLATVIDLCTRMIVGWAMADHMRASLCVSALEMARDKGHLQANGIFHSDHGAQYTSRELGAWCTGNNIRQSMGLAGVCWDNAVAESAFSSLKNEFYHHYSFDTRQAARQATMHYIEAFYNRWRPHSHNDGLPPATAMANFTTQNHQQRAAA
ncbi:IS3 family transposase [Arthrobacter sp. H35-D1]|nr:IS3 family transposase [Arthrobacter sp. H35-D1]MDJ0315262.1 IS3 family transposase [Arthrobacter sp. H35-D1]